MVVYWQAESIPGRINRSYISFMHPCSLHFAARHGLTYKPSNPIFLYPEGVSYQISMIVHAVQ